MIFAIVSAMLLIADATTGGRIKTQTEKHSIVYGVWNPNRKVMLTNLSGLINYNPQSCSQSLHYLEYPTV